MIDTVETRVPEPPLTRAEKTANRIHNERVKLVASLLHGVALATFGLGTLRLVFDPAAQPPGTGTVVLGLMVAVASESAAYYLLGRMKAES